MKKSERIIWRVEAEQKTKELYPKWKISDEEMIYIKADVDVLCEAMEIMQNEDHTKMTNGIKSR